MKILTFVLLLFALELRSQPILVTNVFRDDKGIIRGTLANTTPYRSRFEIKFKFFDKSGAVLGLRGDSIDRLESGEVWKFSVWPVGRESASFQLEYVRSPESIRPVDYIYTTREEQQRAAAREKENRDRLIAAQVERNRAVAEAIRKDTNATARIVAYQLVQASNGYPSFQIEVAKRYLAGDGVTTNRALAIHWLRAACTNGESEATNLLRQINLPP